MVFYTKDDYVKYIQDVYKERPTKYPSDYPCKIRRFEYDKDLLEFKYNFNPFGHGSPGYYEQEAKINGFSSVKEYLTYKRETAPKCGVCGTPKGFAWGTGDCGCGDSYEMRDY